MSPWRVTLSIVLAAGHPPSVQVSSVEALPRGRTMQAAPGQKRTTVPGLRPNPAQPAVEFCKQGVVHRSKPIPVKLNEAPNDHCVGLAHRVTSLPIAEYENGRAACGASLLCGRTVFVLHGGHVIGHGSAIAPNGCAETLPSPSSAKRSFVRDDERVDGYASRGDCCNQLGVETLLCVGCTPLVDRLHSS